MVVTETKGLGGRLRHQKKRPIAASRIADAARMRSFDLKESKLRNVIVMQFNGQFQLCEVFGRLYRCKLRIGPILHRKFMPCSSGNCRRGGLAKVCRLVIEV